jgi:hypothetical protein
VESADVPGGVPNAIDGSLVAPAGRLSFNTGDEIVSISAISMSVVDDTVSAYKEFPSGSEQDSVIRFTVSTSVIPEPSTGLLSLLGGSLLLFRRKRR